MSNFGTDCIKSCKVVVRNLIRPLNMLTLAYQVFDIIAQHLVIAQLTAN